MKTTGLAGWAAAAALFFATNLVAGAADDEKPDDLPDVQSVSVQSGRVLALADGKQTEITNEVTFPKEIVVATNGTFKVAGGKERTLAEGQVLSREGTLTSSDGSIVPVEDHLVLKSGRVILVQDGEPQPLTSAMTLKNGTRVDPSGRMVTPRNLIRRLLDGQIIKLSDSSIEATDTAQLANGKVVLYKDGGRIELRPGQVMAMSDGSRVGSDGFVTKRDGSRVALKEGELYKFAGAGDSR